MIELRSVSKSFGQTRAIDGLDLSVSRGTTTVLVGESGCGKSTVIRLIVGLVSADSGEVSFDGRAVTPESAPALRRRMGYVIQEGGLFPHLTAEQNICLMARHVGERPEVIAESLGRLCDLTRFPAVGLGRYPTELSGGQRQRVSLMRALMLDPDVLLLDEPLGALDPMIRTGLQDELRVIFRDLEKTVVLVTHDIAEAGFFADEIVLLRSGSLVQSGSLEELARHPVDEFVTRFIRSQRRPLDFLDA